MAAEKSTLVSNVRPFRLGDELWSGWARIKKVPHFDFFPRRWYAAVPVPKSQQMLMLGGFSSSDGAHKNDVWQMLLPPGPIDIATPFLIRVSPHDDGFLGSDGRRVLRKWRGREDFGCCIAATHRGGSIVYVAGGVGASSSLFNDVWASEDGGATWRCMSVAPQWPRRRAPSLCAVPGHPDRVVLAGGLAGNAEVMGDAWVTEDAGATWSMLTPPPWSRFCGRYRAAFLPLDTLHLHNESIGRMLLFGGCFIDGGSGGNGGGPGIGLERLLHDAWECRIDGWLNVSWAEWGLDAEERGPAMAMSGVEYATCTIDESCQTLIARLPMHEFVSTAEAWHPQGDHVQWQHMHLSESCDSLMPTSRSIHALRSGCDLTYVRLVGSGVSTGFPRLAFLNNTGLLLTDSREWKRQVRFALLLGLRLEQVYGMFRELWLGRVMTYLMPRMLSDFAASRSYQCCMWKVVSSGMRGGIIVRQAKELDSPQKDERLSYGALVIQEALIGERLFYSKLEGQGPSSGWVSVRVPGRSLLERISNEECVRLSSSSA